MFSARRQKWIALLDESLQVYHVFYVFYLIFFVSGILPVPVLWQYGVSALHVLRPSARSIQGSESRQQPGK